MKKTLLLLTLSFWTIFVQSQTIVPPILTGEYCTAFITNSGTLKQTLWNGSAFVITDMGLSNITKVSGGQYGGAAMNSSGQVWKVLNDGTATQITTQADGRAVTAAQDVYGWWQAYIYRRADSVFVCGQDVLNINGGSTITNPIRLNNPSGRLIKKLVCLSFNGLKLLALADNGTVWKWEGSATPTQISGITTAIDISGIGTAAYVVLTTTDLLAWGWQAQYLGLSWNTTTPTSIKHYWDSAGCIFPIKELVGGYNSLHIIDAHDNYFVEGEDIDGQCGTGDQWPLWRTFTGLNGLTPYHSDYNVGNKLIPVTQVPGKFKNLQTGQTYCFYCYAQDMAGNWYSWGRNKARCLGNGITQNSNDEEDFPNAYDIPAPRMVTPLSQSWTVFGTFFGANVFNINAQRPPVANAGINQYITTSSTTLYGSGSAQQESTITDYLWSKVSGTGGTISSTTTENTNVTGLTTGTYVFKLKVTNSNSLKDSINVTVVVTLPVITPTCQTPPQNQLIVTNVGSLIKTTQFVQANKVTETEIQWSTDGNVYFPVSTTKYSKPPKELNGKYNYPESIHGQYFVQLKTTNDGCVFFSHFTRLVLP